MIKENIQDKIFNIVNLVILTIVLIITLYPLYFVAIASFSDPVMVNSGQVILWPKGINFKGYARVFANKEIWSGYRNTVFYTTLGTMINLMFTMPAAYALSRRDMIGRNFIMTLFTITMFFNGGLIPTYLVVKNLGLTNTFWALLLPSAVSTYNLIVSRTYMQNNIPVELQEAAIIDGSSNTRMLFTIVLPLSKPIIAVMALFYGVGHWNQYFSALIYITDKNLKPLQLILRNILLQNEYMASSVSSDSVETMAEQAKLAESIKYCTIIVASLPVLIVYPFIQKYFTKGIMLGAIRG
ncbi:MAG TPA: carbohydrate ABC transporter permease [Clostridiaceae bacterium]|nr:carbohydrate ABC transporter permease [Clostridiaceae bacterium]